MNYLVDQVGLGPGAHDRVSDPSREVFRGGGIQAFEMLFEVPRAFLRQGSFVDILCRETCLYVEVDGQ